MSEPTASRRAVYRLYVDEVGHAGMKPSTTEAERYLSLIGVACHLDHVKTTIKPQMEELKRFFIYQAPENAAWKDPDEVLAVANPIVFHRKELANKKYPFEALNDPLIREAFDAELLQRLKEWQYTVFSVVIDKDELQTRYVYPSHPYHYALEVLLERYVRWLELQSAIGDVMAEARGGKEDKELKSHYQQLYQKGTIYVKSHKMAKYLSSGELKIKLKTENITGLQLAEFLVRPCYYAALARKKGKAIPTNFGGQVEAVAERSKYYRNERGVVAGFGRKWLP